MAPNFQRSVPIGHGESILFIYRVLFAVHRNDLIYIPRQHNAAVYRHIYMTWVDPGLSASPNGGFSVMLDIL